MSDLDFTSGLLPRVMVFVGKPKAPIPEPPMPDSREAEEIAYRLNQIASFARQLKEHHQGKMELAPDAKAMWQGAYPALRENAGRADFDKQGAMRNRIEVHVLKAAMLFAVCQNHTQIEADDLDIALSLGEYLTTTADMLADLKFGNDLKRLEERLIKVLKARAGQYVSVSEIHQKLGGKVPAADVHRLVRALVALGVVEVHPESDTERPRAIRLYERSMSF